MPTIEVRIATGTDDVEERTSGTMDLTSSDLELVTDGSKVQTVGLRFLGIDIPPGAVITNAYIQFQADEVTTGVASLVIRGEDTGDAAAFDGTAFNTSSRPKTDALIGWNPDGWSTIGEAGLVQRTPDITAIVQEIVSRSDWVALSDMVLLITGTGTRTAEAYESGAAKAPLLHIEYALTGPVVGNLSINDVSVTEGHSGTKLATFTVSRTGTAAFSVDYATANGSATADSDYTAIPLTMLDFAEGETAKTISVTISGDTVIESNETFFVNLSNAVGPGASIIDGTGVGTIVDDDTPAVVGSISINDVSVTEGHSGTKLATFTVSRASGTAAFSVSYATANGSATAGSDYTAIPPTTLDFAAGETAKTISITISGDTVIESNETFFVNLSNALGPGASIVDGSGVGTVLNDDFAPTQPVVRNIWSTTGLASPYGSPDPSGLSYVPGKGMFLCDSEVNESPFNSNTNMFLVQLNNGGPLTLLAAPYNLKGFTIEPTGLAYEPSTDRLYISDDDADRIYWVDPDNPQVKLGQFNTSLSGSTDAEDVAYDGFDGDVNGGDGHLYIANGSYANIREVTTNGALVRTISLPSVIRDPEALLWDDVHNVFFVGGKFSSNIWIVDRNGAILQTITLLGNHTRPGGAPVKVTDLELAPSSNPSDDPGRLSLYVADYGADNFNDGRLFEIDLGDYFFG